MAFLADYITKWILSMSWHLWRIVTLRPYFKGIGDTALSIGSFAAVFFVFGVIRWYGFAGKPLGTVIVGLVAWLVVLIIIFKRSNRSSTLLSVCLGASAVVDATAIFATFIFEADITSRNYFLFECGLYAFATLKFFREPKEIQAHGYQRSKLVEPQVIGKK